MKKNLIFLFALLLTLSFAQAAMSSQENLTVMPESSTVFIDYGAQIDDYSGYIRAITFSDLTGYYSQSIKMELQKYTGGTWSTITSWYGETYDMTFELRETYPASPGTYRVKGTHKAGGEAWISYSPNYIIN